MVLNFLSFKSISTGAQYVTPDNKIYCEKDKICWFSSAVAGKTNKIIMQLQTRV